MKTYLYVLVVALSFALAGCPKEEPAPVVPSETETQEEGLDPGTPEEPE